MIFKQIYSDINKTAIALEALNKIKFNVTALSVADISRIADVKNITTVFNELQSISKADYGDFGALKIQESAVAVSALSGELQASTLMMNGFSEAETRAVLSANGLTDAEIEQALAFAQSGESIKLYNAEVIKAGLQNSALSSTEQKLVLDKLGLIDATTGELISTKQVTQAKLEEALINSGLEASEASVTAERIVSTVAQGTQKASIEAILALTKKQIVENTKYIASMVAAHPVTTALGVALAALGGVILYNTHKEKEYQKALKESVDTMSSATSEYSNSVSKLDELTEKYKDLEKQLSSTNLTEEETYQIKSDLYDVQCDLIDNFGNEAKGIDLVNGEYREQLGLLQQINKEAAEAYLTKNKEDYDNNISYLTDKEDFRSKYTSEWSSKNSGYMSDDLKNILEANGLTIDAEHWRSELGGAFTKYYVEFEGVTREEAYNLAMKLGEVLRNAGEENAELMQDPYYDLVQSYLSYVTTELIDESELNSAKDNADYYEKLSAMYSSSFGDLYNSFVDARDEYMEALQTGENVDNAKINFDNIYGEFQNSSKVKSDEIKNAFADVKNSIDEELVKLNDWEKSLSGSNELDIISSLKVTDDQLRGINWDDEFTSPAEEAFGNLLTYLGASREDIEQVISLLVKMGSVMGEVNVKGDTFNDKYPISTFDQAWADSFTSENDAVKKLGDTLLDLAEKGRLTKEAFNNADSTAGDYFRNLGISADEAVSKINKLVDESKQLSSMSSHISSMADALGTKQENGFVEADTLAGFDVEVRGLDSWDRFQEVLGSTTSSYGECQEAANALATEWVNGSDFLAQLTEQNKEYYATQLDAMGIKNYDEIIESTLALKEAKEALADVDLADATYEDIEALIAEEGYTGLAAEQIWNLYAAKLSEQMAAIDSSADCQQFLNLKDDALLTAESIRLLTELMQIYDGLESGTYGGNQTTKMEAVEAAKTIQSKLENLARGEGEGLIVKPRLNVNGKPGGSGSSKSKKETKDTTKEFDWIEQAIENVKKEVESLDEIADSSYATFSQKNAALAEEIGKVSEEIGLQQQAYEEYMRKADSIGLGDDYKALVQNGSISIEDVSDEKLQEKIDAYQKWYEKAMNASDAIKELNTDLKDLHVSAYELNTAELKDRLDSDSITEKQYLNELKETYERFYGDLEDYAQQYHEAVLDYLKQEKDYLNSVAGAAVSLVDTEIGAVRDGAEEQEERLRRQIELIEDRKKPLQDELDALEEKARKEDLILNLQKAQYAQAKAENQRTKLVKHMPDAIVI